ncbi:MAG: hypothetical protein IPK26_08125 [Planctomycetes bacterium]|nr:hypothetical protein [Planctomycetota bacterium]
MRHLAVALSFALPSVAQGVIRLDGPDLLAVGAFDPGRDRLVLFSGDGGTWELANGVFLARPVVGGPSGRRGAVMVYDDGRRRVVLFGGREPGSSVLLNDSWTWDGAAWARVQTTASPPGREWAGGAFDTRRNRFVLFGGGGSAPSNDTWEFDGSNWQNRQPTTAPVHGGGTPRMAFDSSRGLTVMVTPSGLLGTAMATWEWNGVDWRNRPVGGPWPTTRQNAGLTYDPIRRVTVLSGGTDSSGQWWEWNGYSWRLATTVADPVRQGHVAWYDPQRAQTRMFGGFPPFGASGQGPWRTDVWAFDGNSVTRVHGDLRPSARYGQWLSGDPVAGEAVFFSGFQNVGSPDDTWIFDGNGWRSPILATMPSARSYPAAAFDLTQRRHWLFGGYGGSALLVLDDLWRFENGAWTAVPAAVRPPARAAAGMAHDLTRNRLVLFGGRDTQVFRNDTWEWSGTAWTQIVAGVAPVPRESPGLTFDLGRNRVVLFGGRNGATAQDQFDDTWEYDGAQWTRITVPQSPPPLLSPSLQYDIGRFESWLVGHVFNGPGQIDLHLWRYDGTRWTPIATQVGTTVSSANLALGLVGQRLTMFDGQGVSEWQLGLSAQAVAYGAACGTPATTLSARTRPRLGTSAFGLETMARMGELVVFGLGFQQGSLPLGNGCSLLLGNLDASLAAIPGGSGFTAIALPLPGGSAWFGASIFAQAVVFDPAAGSLRTTQGLRCDLGN